MKKLLTLALVVVATTALSSQAPQRQAAKTVWGEGGMTCGQWTAGRPLVGHDPARAAWALGYISAVASTGAVLRPVDDVWVLGFIGGYCLNHQNETIATATREMLASIATQPTAQ